MSPCTFVTLYCNEHLLSDCKFCRRWGLLLYFYFYYSQRAWKSPTFTVIHTYPKTALSGRALSQFGELRLGWRQEGERTLISRCRRRHRCRRGCHEKQVLLCGRASYGRSFGLTLPTCPYLRCRFRLVFQIVTPILDAEMINIWINTAAIKP